MKRNRRRRNIADIFADFDEWEDLAIFGLSLAIGTLVTISSFPKAGSASIAIGLTIVGVGFYAALLRKKLSILAKNIDLQIRKADADRQSIAQSLEVLIELAKQDIMKTRVKKGLSTILQILETKGLDDMDLRLSVMSFLKKNDWVKSISISAFGLPGQWMDPYWFSYLTVQIARAAEIMSDDVIAKRYFIYNKDLVHEYLDELKLLCDAHDKYVEPFIYYEEDTEEILKKAGLPVIDITFLESRDARRLVLWRNPELDGAVQVADSEKEEMIVRILDILEKEEENLDKKGLWDC